MGTDTQWIEIRAKSEWYRPLTVKHPPDSVGAECTVGLVAVGGLGVEDAVNVAAEHVVGARSAVNVVRSWRRMSVRMVERRKILRKDTAGVAVELFTAWEREMDVMNTTWAGGFSSEGRKAVGLFF